MDAGANRAGVAGGDTHRFSRVCLEQVMKFSGALNPVSIFS